jgi:adenylosuccinate synthase
VTLRRSGVHVLVIVQMLIILTRAILVVQAKAYTTRVGSGPYPTELFGDEGEELRKAGFEWGTTTGRPRRCGWLDIVALNFACTINGFTAINLTKLDVLSGLGEVKLGVAYKTPTGDKLRSFPSDLAVLEQVEVSASLRNFLCVSASFYFF